MTDPETLARVTEPEWARVLARFLTAMERRCPDIEELRDVERRARQIMGEKG